MSISLNEIGYSVANALGKPNDFFLRQTIMLDTIGIRAMLIRQDLSRNTLSKLFLQSLGAVPIKCVDASECPDVPTGTYLLRTVEKVPNPVRTKDDSTFYFVGTPDRSKSFTETTVIGMDLTSHDRYTSKDTKYFYLGGYIYIFNPPTDDLAYINVVSPFADPRETAEFNTCAGADCYTDDSNFPIEMDMWYQIKTLLLQQHGRQVPTEDEEVRINTN